MDQKIINLILMADDDKDDCILIGHSVQGPFKKTPGQFYFGPY
jgi:hypothetical protein